MVLFDKECLLISGPGKCGKTRLVHSLLETILEPLPSTQRLLLSLVYARASAKHTLDNYVNKYREHGRIDIHRGTAVSSRRVYPRRFSVAVRRIHHLTSSMKDEHNRNVHHVMVIEDDAAAHLMSEPGIFQPLMLCLQGITCIIVSKCDDHHAGNFVPKPVRPLMDHMFLFPHPASPAVNETSWNTWGTGPDPLHLVKGLYECIWIRYNRCVAINSALDRCFAIVDE